MEFVLRWLRRNCLVLTHIAVFILLLLPAQFPTLLLNGQKGEWSLLQMLGSGHSPFSLGVMSSQIGMIALWCGLAQQSLLRRITRAIWLLTLGWVVVQLFILAENAVSGFRRIEFPIMMAVGVIILFTPTFLIAGCFRFQNLWTIIDPDKPTQAVWQFTLADLFRTTTLACVILALAVATQQLFESRQTGGDGMIYSVIQQVLVTVAGWNFLLVPIHLFGVWGLLSDNELRFRRSSAIFGGLFAMQLGAVFVLLPAIYGHPIYFSIQSVGSFFLGAVLSGITTAWAVRWTGYRLVRLSQNSSREPLTI